MSIDLSWIEQQFPELSSLQALGHGGQKFVFSGIHDSDGEIVLKIFRSSSDPERAMREVGAVQTTHSRRVPQILELGTMPTPLGDVIWLREKRIHGDNLRNILAKRPRLQATELMKLAAHTLEALYAVEQARIVHRDVKPENIMIDSEGNAWLLDFGLARHLDLTSLTATAAHFGVGTLGYCPIEQLRNVKGDIDSRADLFALGVTLYECAEGINPYLFKARDPGEIVDRLENVPLPAIAQKVDRADEFRELVLAMTRVQKNHRLRSIEQAYKWIQEICSSEKLSLED